MDELKSEVKARIKASNSLQQYDELVACNLSLFNRNSILEQEKRRLDSKIKNGRFVYIIKRSAFYEDLIGKAEQSTSKVEEFVNQTKTHVDQVLKLKNVENVQKDLSYIVSENITIDQLLESKCKISDSK